MTLVLVGLHSTSGANPLTLIIPLKKKFQALKTTGNFSQSPTATAKQAVFPKLPLPNLLTLSLSVHR